MKLVVGLGNPGVRYETTRHNVGFLAVDRLIDAWSAQGPQKKEQAEVYQAQVHGHKVLLIKPQTYMNLSGRSVAPFYTFYQCSPEDLTVIYDDLDLSPVSMKLKVGGGTGGHNGLKSLEECLGAEAKNFNKVRIGIGHPRELGRKQNPADYVLEPFSNAELEGLDPLLDDVQKAVEMILDGQIKNAMTKFNQKKDLGEKE